MQKCRCLMSEHQSEIDVILFTIIRADFDNAVGKLHHYPLAGREEPGKCRIFLAEFEISLRPGFDHQFVLFSFNFTVNSFIIDQIEGFGVDFLLNRRLQHLTTGAGTARARRRCTETLRRSC